MRVSLTALLFLSVLSGCSSERTTINTSQSLVMESSVLSAGIIASEPAIGELAGQQRAVSDLVNEQDHPVRLYYRFYWYDDRGLEILPYEKPRELVIDARSQAKVSSQTGNLTASKVRLYLYL